MNEKTFSEFHDEIQTVMTKYEAQNWCLAFNCENKFSACTEKAKSVGHLMEIALNVGRLWQHVRQTVKSALDNFEGTWNHD